MISMMCKLSGFRILILVVILLLLTGNLLAQPLPRLTVGVDKSKEPEDLALTIQIVILMTILSLAPAIIIMMTSFTRIIVVFFFLRQALNLQQMPPNQLLAGLALFLTAFIMAPVGKEINQTAIQPYLKKEISQEVAIQKAMVPIRHFMLAHVREKDLALFVKLAGIPKPENESELPTYLLIPSFIISELSVAFQIGFILYIPFLVIDVIVASVLMSMGMMMLPPIMISMPFKILLFVLVDGWNLLVDSLLKGIVKV